MADYVEKWGDDVEQAVQYALKELKVSADEVTYTVLEEPTKGFLGLFNKKLAKVRVEIKKPEAAPAEQKEVKPEPKAVHTEPSVKTVDESVQNTESTESAAPQHKRSERPEKKTARKENRRNERRYDAPEVPSEEAPAEEGRTSTLMNTKFTIDADDTAAVVADNEPAIEFINKIAADMGLSVNAEGKILDGVLYVNLSGKDVGPLIGKRGQTLDAVQYLASIVENKVREDHLRVVINAENYREKREKTLQTLARRLADKCVRNGRNVKLEPMNPYERKVIHSTLQSNPRVTTRSEGVEPNRRVIIEYVRGGRR